MKSIKPYSVAVVDIGSPKLGNIGWSLTDAISDDEWSGQELDDLFPMMTFQLKKGGVLLGLEAPLFIPIREDLYLATKARLGEARRPWSAGAGAQVLAMNLPIMIYIFKKILDLSLNAEFLIDADSFKGNAGQILLFEAFVSGSDKGDSHVEDAQIMSRYCRKYSIKKNLPDTIMGKEPGVSYFNLAAAALLQCGGSKNMNNLHIPSPIYRPSDS